MNRPSPAPPSPWNQPPETSADGWLYNRRSEALSYSVTLAAHLCVLRSKGVDEFNVPDKDELEKIAEDAFTITSRLVALADAAHPRRPA